MEESRVSAGKEGLNEGCMGMREKCEDSPPPSKMPSRMRTPRNVSKLWTQAEPMVTAPNAMHRNESHLDPTFLRTRFEGTVAEKVRDEAATRGRRGAWTTHSRR